MGRYSVVCLLNIVSFEIVKLIATVYKKTQNRGGKK